MEVNIALLVMAMGVLGLLALFPVGLRQGDAASSDTADAGFADLVLNAMHANAQAVTNWNDWVSVTNGILLGVSSGSPASIQITVPQKGTSGTTSIPIYADGVAHSIPASPTSTDGYLIKGQYIQYVLTLTPGPGDLMVTAAIQVTNRRYTTIANTPTYYTAFVYMGM